MQSVIPRAVDVRFEGRQCRVHSLSAAVRVACRLPDGSLPQISGPGMQHALAVWIAGTKTLLPLRAVRWPSRRFQCIGSVVYGANNVSHDVSDAAQKLAVAHRAWLQHGFGVSMVFASSLEQCKVLVGALHAEDNGRVHCEVCLQLPSNTSTRMHTCVERTTCG